MKIDNIFNKIKLYSYIITLKVKSTGVNNILSSTIINKIKLYSYIITLKVKSTGVNNILSSTITNKNTHIYPCPSNIYLNYELFQNYTDCHFIDIKESDTEIKLEWDNIVSNSLSGIFYNCINIIEVDMTNFDTSLITDMTEMFSMCHSLKSLNVQNLNTAKVFQIYVF